MIVAVIGLVVPNPLTVDPGATRLIRTKTLLDSAEDEIAAVQAGGRGGGRTPPRRRHGHDGADRRRQAMALLPLMTRPSAQRMLVICFGMGSAYRRPSAGLDVDGVELVPSVPDDVPLVL